ncbi:MAG: hypothetical protein U9Q97_03780, partial [Acidobacteriota bacterium]|nr:hypothetical protein [Acidobacteriota bacterium]
DLLEAAKELLPDDEITDDSKAVLAGLGAELPDNDNKAKLSEKPEKEEPKEMSKSDKAEKPAVKKAGNESKPGVIASILEFIKDSKEGITVLQIQEKLVARFADRKPEAMLKTVKAQVAGKKRPLRMEKEKKVTFEIQDGKYSVK